MLRAIPRCASRRLRHGFSFLVASCAGASVAFVAIAPDGATAVTEHTVAPGETLGEIAVRYGFPVSTLVDVNGLSDPDRIVAGQQLRIPQWVGGSPAAAVTSTRDYVVQPGDTAAAIAGRAGITVEQLTALNTLANPALIFAGQVLRLPGNAPAPGATGTPTAAALHRVQPGDTLTAIAGRYGVWLTDLLALNGLQLDSIIYAGEELLIPGSTAVPASEPAVEWVPYTVQPGDTLGSLASALGVTVAALVEANAITNPNLLVAGSTITLPGRPQGPREAPPPTVSHAIQPGETLSSIAQRYGVTVLDLIEANSIPNVDRIRIGDVIRIPGSAIAASAPAAQPQRVHRVQPGESLSGIAARFGVSVSALAAANGIGSDGIIHPGQVLALPGAVIRELSRDEYAAILDAAAREFGMPPALIKAQAWIESGWQMGVISHANAVGIMQILPTTAEWALEFIIPDAPEWETNARDNARMGAAIMRHWYLQSGGDMDIALAAYYQGWDAVWSIGFYQDTREYIAAVYAFVPRFQ
jgi:LysM repeat protein